MLKYWIGLTTAAMLSAATPAIALADEPASGKEAQSSLTGTQVAGGVLIGVGGACIFTGGIITFIDLDRGGPFSGVTALIVGVPLLGAGVLMNGIGIPMYLLGGKKDKPSASFTPPPPPVTVSVGVGLGSASLKMTF